MADSFDPITGQTIASAPSAKQASNTCPNVPGDGAAVLGNGASGASIRAQNCSVVRSTPTLSSSAPNRMNSGTTTSPAPAATEGARSALESVTIATRPMRTLLALPPPPMIRRPRPRSTVGAAQPAGTSASTTPARRS